MVLQLMPRGFYAEWGGETSSACLLWGREVCCLLDVIGRVVTNKGIDKSWIRSLQGHACKFPKDCHCLFKGNGRVG